MTALPIPKNCQLDEADIYDILARAPGWNDMSIARRQELQLDLLSALDEREINPFAESLLETAVERWRENLMATLSITSFVLPQDIESVYARLKDWTQKQKDLESERKLLLIERETAEALMANAQDFKWGKNETEREAQFRSAEPTLAKRIDDNEKLLKDAANQVALINIDVKRIEALLSYFQTKIIEVAE